MDGDDQMLYCLIEKGMALVLNTKIDIRAALCTSYQAKRELNDPENAVIGAFAGKPPS